MTTQAEVRTRILVISDTHCALPAAAESDVAFRHPLPKVDVLLHAGDLTMNGQVYQHERAIELIKGIEAELKVVVPGSKCQPFD